MFDPTIKTEPDTASSLEAREVGGLGLYLIKSFAERVFYDFVGGKNRLTLEHEDAHPMPWEKNGARPVPKLGPFEIDHKSAA